MKNIKRLFRYCFLLLLLTPLLAPAATFNKNGKKSLEVRVLVDVSDRMVISDPDNHRVAALKLFIKLLPNNANAGIWMFDGATTELIKTAKSGISWKTQALKNVDKVHSNGKTADIERALAVASLDWVEKNPKESRHIILLTDGKITSGRTKADNLASKQRILNYQITRLKAADVSVHTIGFSEDADVEFLDAIATETVGWFDVAKTAEQLEKTLLRVNKRLVEKNRIPLIANKFTVDETVRQFTAVVFRKKGFGSTQLDDPEGMDFGRSSDRTGVTWHREKKFDIVTVTKPMEGEWLLIAPNDPNNEIFITTNLQMALDDLPKEIYAGSDTRIRILMTDRGKLLKNSNVLSVIEASVEITNKRGDKEVFEMEQDMITGGYFFVDLGKDFKVGPYELVARAVGNTFERIESATFHVKPKPAVNYTEIKLVFKQVLADAGIVIAEKGVTDDEMLQCPDLSKIVVGGACPIAPVQEPVEEETDWIMAGGIVLLVNLLLAAGGFFGFKIVRKKAAEEDESLMKKVAT
ncbi:MAG: vWA domain-containing protein [Cycloclasticus sp.]